MKNTKDIPSMIARILQLETTLGTLKTKEMQYRHLFEQAPIMIYVIDKEGCFMNINQAGVLMMGYEFPRELIGKKFQNFFFNEKNEADLFQDKMQFHGLVKDFETSMVHKNGDIRLVNITGTTRTSVLNKLDGYEGFITDITHRVATENQLKKSERKYRAILDNSLAAIYMFQEGGYFSFVNKRFIEILGYNNEQEILGKPFWEFIAPEDRGIVKTRGLQREHKESEPRRYPYRMLAKDGSIVWVDMQSSHAAYMGIPAAVGNFIDITKRKKAQKKVEMLSRKLIEGIEEERRSLASDIHDEFGQALMLLQFDMETLKQTLPIGSHESWQACDKIMNQIQVLAEKVRNTTSRLRPGLLDHLGLVPTLKWSIREFNQRITDVSITFQAIGFKRRLPPEIEIVIYRIFQESLNNITKHSQADRVDIKLTYSHPQVFFLIQDNGCGFIQEEDGMPLDGTSKGIGLLSMKERVAFLNGTIKIKSMLHKGTVIRVELPIN